MVSPDRSHAIDKIVVVLFENRSLDNVLGHLYGPEDGKNFDGVIGKDLSNPIPGLLTTIPDDVAAVQFKFDRSGYRVPAILVSPWVPKGRVFNDEYRHTSLIATLRKTWNLGEALTQRDASARTFDDLFTLETPRDPETWATVAALPVPAWHLDEEALGKGLSGLGKSMGHGIIEHARELGLELPPQLQDPAAEPTPEDIIEVFRQVAWQYFPLLAPDSAAAGRPAST